MLGVRSFVPNWLPGLNETANFVLPIPLKTVPEPALSVFRRVTQGNRLKEAGVSARELL
jgi:hypothetical protein